MDNFDSINEVLDYAIEQEIVANKFYLDLANKSSIPAMKEVFESFAREEQGHRAGRSRGLGPVVPEKDFGAGPRPVLADRRWNGVVGVFRGHVSGHLPYGLSPSSLRPTPSLPITTAVISHVTMTQ